MNTKKLEAVARKLPPWITRYGKRFATHLRARDQIRECKQGFRNYGDQYSQPILFIAGLPKSGSTWIEKMVSSYEGYHEYLLPAVTNYELHTGGSHDFELPVDMFDTMKHMLLVTKMHIHGSPNNVSVLRDNAINYVVLHRDLRDVAVSYHFYVRNTPWHPEHKRYRSKTVQDGLELFSNRLLPAYIDWVRSWKRNADPDNSIQIRYEDMLEDPVAGMTRIATLFNLDASAQTIHDVVELHSFKKMSGGRDSGDSSANAFARKGVSGDWKNHFTAKLREQYGHLLCDFLIETGDEKDDAWITMASDENL